MQVKINWNQKDMNGRTALEVVDSSAVYQHVASVLHAAHTRDYLQETRKKEMSDRNLWIGLVKRPMRGILMDEHVQQRLFSIFPILGTVFMRLLDWR